MEVCLERKQRRCLCSPDDYIPIPLPCRPVYPQIMSWLNRLAHPNSRVSRPVVHRYTDRASATMMWLLLVASIVSPV